MEWVDKSHITKGIGTYIVIFILMLIPNVFFIILAFMLLVYSVDDSAVV